MTTSSGLAAPCRKSAHSSAALPAPAGIARLVRLSVGCASLALLAACSAGGGGTALGPSAGYYVAHATPQSYQPPGPPSDPWGPYISAASQRFDVPASWIRNVMRVESGGNEYMDGHLTVSAAGAMGLMQLEPATYRDMAAQFGLGADPFNPYDNIMAGTAYLHEMYLIYGSPGFLAAYNAGPGRLDEYVNDHVPLPEETQAYLAMIAPHIEGDYPGGNSADEQLAMNPQPETGDNAQAGGALSSPPVTSSPQQMAFAQTALPAPVSSAPEAAVASVPSPAQVAALVSGGAASALYMQPPSEPPPREPASMPAPPPPPQRHFEVVPAAMADTPPVYRPRAAPAREFVPEGPSGWAIQVGAYPNPGDAKAALGIAELSAAQMLGKSRPFVMSVFVRGHTYYRARFGGLEREAAQNACDRLSSGPTGCEVLSPEAQS